jgi:hypothetical protein
MSDSQSMQHSDDRRIEKLAAFLGLSVDELSACQWSEVVDENEDGFVFGLILTFDDSTPEEILDKLVSLQPDRSVSVPIWVLEDDEAVDGSATP